MKNEIVACLLMEQVSEPEVPKIINVIKQPGANYARFQTCLQDFDVFNRNLRKYLLQPMREAWEDEHIRELMSMGTFFGENGHPLTKDPQRIVTIDPNNCCHRILDKEFVGNKLYATIETLNDGNGPGASLLGHILQGAKTAFSLRALAPITKVEAGRGEIRSKPRIITYDRVILPSHKVAYQQGDSIELIHESTMVDTQPTVVKHEDVCVEINQTTMESLCNFLVEESKNIKSFIDIFDVDCEHVQLDSTGKNLILQESDVCGTKRTFTVSMESYVRDQVHDILRKL